MPPRAQDGPCRVCVDQPAARCGRCAAPLCAAHAPVRGARCAGCEVEWDEERRTRRAVQQMFAPPAFLLAGGLAFGLLMPVLMALPFAVGAAVVATVSTSVGFTAAAGTCRLVDRTARAQFLRERTRGLPEARLVRWHHHPRPRALPPGA